MEAQNTHRGTDERIAIVGLGYVGLPLAIAFAKAGRHVVDLTEMALSDIGLALREANVLVLGVSFKRDIDDARNSPSERIIEILINRGAKVSYYTFVTQHAQSIVDACNATEFVKAGRGKIVRLGSGVKA